MKLPKYIKIKGQKYKIIYNKNLSKESIYGDTDMDYKIIRICNSLEGEKLLTTLIHEIGHAIQFETGISQAISVGLQEIICENFSTVFNDIFKIRFK